MVANVIRSAQVTLRGDDQGLHLHLPPLQDAAADRENWVDPDQIRWQNLWDDLNLCLQSSRCFWQRGCWVTLWAEAWPLDLRQIQAIGALLPHFHLVLWRIQTQRRSTAVAAASLGYCVEQVSSLLPPVLNNAAPLYLRTTIRSGSEVRHPGSVLMVGDLNPGAAIVAGGDILVWGRLRGVAHAGSHGDAAAIIAATELDPTQLRIAQQVARPPADKSSQPEVAYLQDQAICIASVPEFLSLYRASRGRV